MNNEQDQIIKEITCSICYSIFKEPFTISCGHTFCKICIKKWLKIAEICPICKRYCTELPEGENIIIKSISEKYRDYGNRNQTIDSGNNITTSNSFPVIKFRNDCLCDKCTEKVLLMSSTDKDEDFNILIKKNKHLLCDQCNNIIFDNNASSMEKHDDDDIDILTEKEIQMLFGNEQHSSITTVEEKNRPSNFQYKSDFDFPDSGSDDDDNNITKSYSNINKKKRHYPLTIFNHQNSFPMNLLNNTDIHTFNKFTTTKRNINTSRKTIENRKRESWCDNSNMCSTCKEYINYIKNPNRFKNPKRPCINRPSAIVKQKKPKPKPKPKSKSKQKQIKKRKIK